MPITCPVARPGRAESGDANATCRQQVVYLTLPYTVGVCTTLAMLLYRSHVQEGALRGRRLHADADPKQASCSTLH